MISLNQARKAVNLWFNPRGFTPEIIMFVEEDATTALIGVRLTKLKDGQQIVSHCAYGRFSIAMGEGYFAAHGDFLSEPLMLRQIAFQVIEATEATI